MLEEQVTCPEEGVREALYPASRCSGQWGIGVSGVCVGGVVVEGRDYVHLCLGGGVGC